MKQTNPTNVTKEGHVLHFFTERDEVVVGLPDGSIHVCPMHHDNRHNKTCYTLNKKAYALPEHLQITLTTY